MAETFGKRQRAQKKKERQRNRAERKQQRATSDNEMSDEDIARDYFGGMDPNAPAEETEDDSGANKSS